MNYILDTCVLSEMVKPDPAKLVIEWICEQDENNLYLSVITIGEIQKGISKLPQSHKKKELQNWLQVDLRDRFNGRILAIDDQVAIAWGTIQATAECNGSPIPSIDGLIAATGISHNMTIVTRNIHDMAPSGATLFNPWDK